MLAPRYYACTLGRQKHDRAEDAPTADVSEAA